MLNWLNALTTTEVALVVPILGGIGWFIKWVLNRVFPQKKAEVSNNNQKSTISGNDNTVKQTNIDGNSSNQTTNNTGISLEQFTEKLEKKEQEIRALLVDKALSERDRLDLTEKKMKEIGTKLLVF